MVWRSGVWDYTTGTSVFSGFSGFMSIKFMETN